MNGYIPPGERASRQVQATRGAPNTRWDSNSSPQRFTRFDMFSSAPATSPSPVCPLRYRMEAPKMHAYDKLVTVRFESTQESYQVHQGLIGHFSDYFRGAFSGHFEEGKTGLVTLPEEDLVGFRVFFEWMYTGRLFDTPKERQDTRAYIFAKARGIPGLKNAIINWVLEEVVHAGDGDDYRSADLPVLWESTPDGDGFRKLIVDLFTRQHLSETFFDDEKAMEQMPKELLTKILRNVGTKEGRPKYQMPQWFRGRRCEYHDHRDMLKKGAEGEKANGKVSDK